MTIPAVPYCHGPPTRRLRPAQIGPESPGEVLSRPPKKATIPRILRGYRDYSALAHQFEPRLAEHCEDKWIAGSNI
jgi:hypothetical protein